MRAVPARARLDAAAVFVYLALGTMFTAGPRYVTEHLGGTRAIAGFSVSIFFVAAVLTRPVVGRLVDRHGRRPFLVVPPVAIVVLLFGFHLAHSVPAVLALRFGQGVAGSAFYVAAVTASTDLSPADRRASAVARLSIAIYAGFAFGPLLAEWVFDRGPGTAWTVIGLVAALGAVLAQTLPETRPAGVAATIAARPAGAPRPRLVHPEAVLPGIALLTLGIGYTSVTSQSTLYARSLGLTSSSILYLTFAVSIVVVRLASGRLADRLGPLAVLFPGMAALAAGLLAMAVAGGLPLAVAGVALVGTGWALVFPACTAWVSGRVPDDERGAVIGSLVAFMDIGQGGGGYLVGAVADAAGFGWAFAVPALAALGGMAVMSAATRRPAPVLAAPAVLPADGT